MGGGGGTAPPERKSAAAPLEKPQDLLWTHNYVKDLKEEALTERKAVSQADWQPPSKGPPYHLPMKSTINRQPKEEPPAKPIFGAGGTAFLQKPKSAGTGGLMAAFTGKGPGGKRVGWGKKTATSGITADGLADVAHTDFQDLYPNRSAMAENLALATTTPEEAQRIINSRAFDVHEKLTAKEVERLGIGHVNTDLLKNVVEVFSRGYADMLEEVVERGGKAASKDAALVGHMWLLFAQQVEQRMKDKFPGELHKALSGSRWAMLTLQRQCEAATQAANRAEALGMVLNKQLQQAREEITRMGQVNSATEARRIETRDDYNEVLWQREKYQGLWDEAQQEISKISTWQVDRVESEKANDQLNAANVKLRDALEDESRRRRAAEEKNRFERENFAEERTKLIGVQANIEYDLMESDRRILMMKQELMIAGEKLATAVDENNGHLLYKRKTDAQLEGCHAELSLASQRLSDKTRELQSAQEELRVETERNMSYRTLVEEEQHKLKQANEELKRSEGEKDVVNQAMMAARRQLAKNEMWMREMKASLGAAGLYSDIWMEEEPQDPVVSSTQKPGEIVEMLHLEHMGTQTDSEFIPMTATEVAGLERARDEALKEVAESRTIAEEQRVEREGMEHEMMLVVVRKEELEKRNDKLVHQNTNLSIEVKTMEKTLEGLEARCQKLAEQVGDMDEQLLDGNVARGCLERELEAAKRQLSNAGGEKQKLFDSLHALKHEVQEGARREAAAGAEVAALEAARAEDAAAHKALAEVLAQEEDRHLRTKREEAGKRSELEAKVQSMGEELEELQAVNEEKEEELRALLDKPVTEEGTLTDPVTILNENERAVPITPPPSEPSDSEGEEEGDKGRGKSGRRGGRRRRGSGGGDGGGDDDDDDDEWVAGKPGPGGGGGSRPESGPERDAARRRRQRRLEAPPPPPLEPRRLVMVPTGSYKVARLARDNNYVATRLERELTPRGPGGTYGYLYEHVDAHAPGGFRSPRPQPSEERVTAMGTNMRRQRHWTVQERDTYEWIDEDLVYERGEGDRRRSQGSSVRTGPPRAHTAGGDPYVGRGGEERMVTLEEVEARMRSRRGGEYAPQRPSTSGAPRGGPRARSTTAAFEGHPPRAPGGGRPRTTPGRPGGAPGAGQALPGEFAAYEELSAWDRPESAGSSHGLAYAGLPVYTPPPGAGPPPGPLALPHESPRVPSAAARGHSHAGGRTARQVKPADIPVHHTLKSAMPYSPRFAAFPPSRIQIDVSHVDINEEVPLEDEKQRMLPSRIAELAEIAWSAVGAGGAPGGGGGEAAGSGVGAGGSSEGAATPQIALP